MKNLSYSIVKIKELFIEPDGDNCYVIGKDFGDDSIKEKINKYLDLDEHLKNNLIIVVVFYDGSIPKREIKNVFYDSKSKKLLVETNKKDLKISTMDYRYHQFLLSVENIDIKEAKFK